MLAKVIRQLWRRRSPSSAHGGAHAQAVDLLRQGRLREAEAALRALCAAHPHDAEGWHLLGHVLGRGGDARGAMDALERAAALTPSNTDALYNLATAARDAGEPARALALFERITVLRPDWYAPWAAGAELHAPHDLDRAEDMYRHALELAPAVAETHYNFGNHLLRCARAEEAIPHYRRAIELDASFVRAYSNLLCALNYADSETPERIRDAHFEFAARYEKPLEGAWPQARVRRQHPRIRVGYVSPDLRNHAVGRLVEPALAHHDRGRFDLYCYSDVRRPDERTQRFRRYAAVWRDTVPCDDEALAAAIREDEIDILVDLTGHTDAHRLLVFARKPAPVQVTWIGYPNTTGLRAVDYRITDAHADPPGLTEHLHSERLLRMPEVYLPCARPEDEVAVSAPPCLVRGYVTFGSFNALVKITPRTIAMWARILERVPASRLLFVTVPEGRTRARLSAAFARHGIGAERLELRGRLAHAEFLRAHADVDIALDPYPYHGTTTSIHTLWMGVPFVTLAGPTHRSRVGLSMLANVGLSELAAATEADYVERAAALAADVERLCALRAALRGRVESGPLMDGPRFARALDALYAAIWEAYCRGEARAAPPSPAST